MRRRRSIVPRYRKYLRLYLYKPFWRNRLHTLLVILFIIFIIVFLRIWLRSVGDRIQLPYDAERDDEQWEEAYIGVLKRWYTGNEDAWYNGKNITLSDTKNWERYIDHVRQHWIYAAYDPKRKYKLKNPLTADTSAGQADIILETFNNAKNGFFVECGAYDGETRSNTLVLERFFGWTGLLIEADPINFSKMVRKNRRALLSPSCLAVHPYPSVNTFLMADNVGRLHEPNEEDRHRQNSADVAYTGQHIKVQCIPFAHLMAALNVTAIDYFSLDIEGSELEVLKTIPFDKIDITALSVEFSHIESDVEELNQFMDSKGYIISTSLTREDRLANDIIYVKKEENSNTKTSSTDVSRNRHDFLDVLKRLRNS
ncbi:uncharacterized protein LOC108629500 [Ceratina calcarata]|uniref:Uncharacterized protein LOC108629500 n=1 Tax=Ceratina calcarata TaxID=156304 RepID=A0AAJ7JA10_9HYME|nr:uncharacterized protein LOC108629500 [Ceratina calcarata]